MMRSKRFEPIQEIASTSARDLSRAMSEAGRHVADLEGQLERMKTRRDEYLRGSTADRGAMNAANFQNYRSFLERLGEVLRRHSLELRDARVEYERRRLQWSEKRIEAESLGRMIDRCREEERYAAEQCERREGDDAAMRFSIEHGRAGKR
ncbi:MAG: flagellar export protein FliJ [Pseudomonadota bacterium]|nr:flagellar export protein FliJ [Pseudomonadota bacterium]